ncbi:MAG: sigma-70 family RNA polymerase sigma factor [Lentisphaeraceae bacterium]|nr:sigma-70 family RNA polymerase sigma factor [Lentisphaeraceae bacterium]
MNKDYVTRKSLLLRACDKQNSQAWEDFIEVYKKFIFHLLRKMSINDNDIDDLFQKISLRLWKALPKYDSSKGKFRSWLSKVVRNEVLNYFRSKKSKNEDFEVVNEALNDEPALDKLIEDEWEKYILTMALENLEKIFSGQAIKVFRLSLAGYSNQKISEETDIKLESVKVLKSRVKGRCIEEIKKIVDEFEQE